MPKSKLLQPYSKERLKLVLDSTRLGMWDWNPQTNDVVFDNNWASMLGLAVDDLTMTLDDWSSRVHPDDMDSCMADIAAHLEGKTDFYENLHRMRHKDGHWVYILDRGRVVERDEAGNAIRFTGTHSDLTPLKQAEFNASLAIKAKERFFSSMSHELRAPIHAMLGLIAQARKKITQPELQKQLEIVDDSGQHLLLIINDILSAAKLQSGSINLNESEFSLANLVNHVSDLFQYRAQEKGLQLIVKTKPELKEIFIQTDRARLSQILINLVSNAIKFTEEGEINICVESGSDGIKLEVCDTGPGIADIESIFQPFFTKERVGRIDDIQSTGLGLGIVKEITNLLTFTLDVDSEIGKGSRFSVCIPSSKVVSQKQEDTKHQNTEKPDITHWPHSSVLLVDDSSTNLMLLKLMLEDSPLEVKATSEAKKALQLVEELGIDVVITDFHMPGMGGLELVSAIRQLDIHYQPIIIIASADGRGDIWPLCQEAGADYYLEKPFDEEDLLVLLDTIVTTREVH